MTGGGDEIWASSSTNETMATADTPSMCLPAMSSLQYSIAELDQQPGGGKLIANVLAWLRSLSSSSSLTAPDTVEQLSMLKEIYAGWINVRATVSDALCFALAEIAVWLSIHTNSDAATQQFQTTTLRPVSLPHSHTFCDCQRQVDFACALFDAVCGPLASTETRQAPVVLNMYITWMATAMRGYEFVFLHHVGQPLVLHIQQKHRVLPTALARAAERIVEQGVKTHPTAPTETIAVAVAAILLSTSTHPPKELQSLHALVNKQLQSGVFPHVHSATAFLAMALRGVTSPLTNQFLLLRSASLVLLSPRLTVSQDEIKQLCAQYQESLSCLQLRESDITSLLRMMESCTIEIKTAMQANTTMYCDILATMRKRNEIEILRPSLVALLESRDMSSAATAGDQQHEPAFPVEPFFANVYDAISTGIQGILQASSPSSSAPSDHVVMRCFATLVRLEYMRECCATAQRNALILELTQRVEAQTETTPDATLSSLAAIVLSPSEAPTQTQDVAFGWTCLAVGLLLQRKLRVLLLRASDAVRRDAFAAVFAGLYHGLEPLDGFVHRFLGFTLSSLGQFVSVYEIFPFYLQQSLQQFPENASKQRIASVMGTVFGALYYTDAGAATMSPSTAEEKAIATSAPETRYAMVLWALRRSRSRVEELLSLTEHNMSGNGLYLAELFLEVAKMAPVEMLTAVAQEIEALVLVCSELPGSEQLLSEIKMRVFNAISQNCEAEKRAWLAAWFLELDAQYPSTFSSAAQQQEQESTADQQAQHADHPGSGSAAAPSAGTVASRL